MPDLDPLSWTKEQRAANLRKLRIPTGSPLVTIFVRHTPKCKYRDDEFFKRCNCRKHFRWSSGGKQHRRKAATRSWAEAEDVKRKLEDQLAGRVPSNPKQDVRTLTECVDLFIADKRNQGVTADVIDKYTRELDRLKRFAETRGIFTVAGLSKELFIEYQAEWDKLYPSANTRRKVQTRLRTFLGFIYDNKWLDRVPRLSPIKPDEVPTLPLTDAEYTRLLETVPKSFPESKKAARVRALVQLMRGTGLAIRDAVTIQRGEVIHDSARNVYRVTTKRQKTGTHVSVPIPEDVALEILAVLNDNPTYVFWSGNGKEKSATTNWQTDLRKLFRDAKVTSDGQMLSHRIRDTFACDLLTKGIALEDVSKLLGHESIVTTEKHYSAWVRGRQERLDTLVMGAWKPR